MSDLAQILHGSLSQIVVFTCNDVLYLKLNLHYVFAWGC